MSTNQAANEIQPCSLTALSIQAIAALRSLFFFLVSILPAIKDLSDEHSHFEKMLCSQFRGAVNLLDRHTVQHLALNEVKARAPSTS